MILMIGLQNLIKHNIIQLILLELKILRDIDYKAGKKAFIHVYPNSQVVELRYAKIYL